jgi:hypothetical protein
MKTVCVHCDKAIVYRPEFGDYEHAEDGWTHCFPGAPTRAMPRRDTPLEPVETQVLKTRAGYFVSSKSTPGAFYLVSGADCTCPATVQRCRHQRAVQELVKAENAQFARPVAKPNVAALCD